MQKKLVRIGNQSLVIEYTEDRNYFILPNRQQIMVEQIVEMGNRGWVDASRSPFNEVVEHPVQAVNTRFPLVAVITKDGKLVYVKESYVIEGMMGNIRPATEPEPIDLGSVCTLQNAGDKIKLNKTTIETRECYVLSKTENRIYILLEKKCVIGHVDVPSGATDITVDCSGNKLFVPCTGGIATINLLTRQVEGPVSVSKNIKKINVQCPSGKTVLVSDNDVEIRTPDLQNIITTIEYDNPQNTIYDPVHDKTYIVGPKQCCIYDGVYSPQKCIDSPNTIFSHYDPVAEKIYLVKPDSIITIDTIRDEPDEVIPIPQVIAISTISTPGFVYAITPKELINIPTGDRRPLPFTPIDIDTDDDKIWVSGDRGVVILKPEIYIPDIKHPVEVNRSLQPITGAPSITVHINPAMYTPIPDLVRIIEDGVPGSWQPIDSIVDYTIVNKPGTHNICVECRDKNGNDIQLPCVPVIYNTTFPDSRHDIDLVPPQPTTPPPPKTMGERPIKNRKNTSPPGTPWPPSKGEQPTSEAIPREVPFVSEFGPTQVDPDTDAVESGKAPPDVSDPDSSDVKLEKSTGSYAPRLGREEIDSPDITVVNIMTGSDFLSSDMPGTFMIHKKTEMPKTRSSTAVPSSYSGPSTTGGVGGTAPTAGTSTPSASQSSSSAGSGGPPPKDKKVNTIGGQNIKSYNPNVTSRSKDGHYGEKVSLPCSGNVTSGFGTRSGQYAGPHGGVDVGVPVGTPINSPISGKVIYNQPAGGYGYIMIIEDDKGYRHSFAHMRQSGYVSVGQTVKAGQAIGKSGDASYSKERGIINGGYAAHLHYQVNIPNTMPWGKAGQTNTVDPIAYFGGKL